MNASNEYKVFRKSLQEAIGVYKSPEETERGMALFDSIAKQGERGDMALEVTLNSLGMKETTAGVAEYVAGQLAKLGKMPKPETDSVKRFRELVKRINSNIDKASISIDGQDFSGFALKEAKIKNIVEDIRTFTATASRSYDGKKCDGFGVMVIERIVK